MWPGFKSRRRRHMWVEFVVGSLLCYETFFSGYSGFTPPQKPTFPKKNLFVDVLPPNRYLLFIIIYLFILGSPYILIVFPGLKAYSPVRFGELNS